MPWNENNGGWQGGNGSNGSGSGGNGGPWGQGPNRPRGPQRPGGGNQPPDLEEILKRGQDRLKNVLPRGGRGGGSGGGSGLPKFTPALLGLIAIGAIVLYAFGGFYRVEADEVAVELVFGDPKEEVLGEGLQFVFWPVETYEKVQINERRVVVGSGSGGSRSTALMLTGDQNIADVSFTVLYSIDDINKFLFEVADPEQIIAEVADSAMREVVGRRPVDDVYRDARGDIQREVSAIVQDTLNRYNTGIFVRDVQLGNAAPPPEVSDAFEEVQRAEQDEDRVQEEANRERNRVLGAVRGEAAAIREEAAAYKNRIVQEAEGEAARFVSVYEQYARAPEVTRKRLFLETMEEVLADSNKVIVESGQGGQGVVPYLPLPELQNRQRNNASSTNANRSGN